MDDTTRLCLNLFTAWAAHDAEELLTMSRTSRDTLSRLPRWAPIPAEIRTRGISQAHVNVSLAIMAAFIGAAAIDGARTGGSSALFRGAVLAFGAHGFTHLAGSALTRGYTTGVVTAPTIVIPYWLRVRRHLRRHGIREIDPAATAVAVAAFPLMPAVHLVARAILGERSLGAQRPGSQ